MSVGGGELEEGGPKAQTVSYQTSSSNTEHGDDS